MFSGCKILILSFLRTHSVIFLQRLGKRTRPSEFTVGTRKGHFETNSQVTASQNQSTSVYSNGTIHSTQQGTFCLVWFSCLTCLIFYPTSLLFYSILLIFFFFKNRIASRNYATNYEIATMNSSRFVGNWRRSKPPTNWVVPSKS